MSFDTCSTSLRRYRHRPSHRCVKPMRTTSLGCFFVSLFTVIYGNFVEQSYCYELCCKACQLLRRDITAEKFRPHRHTGIKEQRIVRVLKKRTTGLHRHGAANHCAKDSTLTRPNEIPNRPHERLGSHVSNWFKLVIVLISRSANAPNNQLLPLWKIK